MYIPPPPPPPIRESRYGAVAVYANPKDLWDSKTMFASVCSIHSKESARQMAQQACNSKSGHSYRIEFDYADQCVSVAMGDVTEGLMLFYGLSEQPGQARWMRCRNASPPKAKTASLSCRKNAPCPNNTGTTRRSCAGHP